MMEFKFRYAIGMLLTGVFCSGLFYISCLIFPWFEDNSGTFFVSYFTLITFFMLVPGFIGLFLGIAWILEDK